MSEMKCPICDNKLEIKESLHVDNYVLYNPVCFTDGCLINLLDWDYDKKETLEKCIQLSNEMVEERIRGAIRERVATKLHYNHKGKSICNQGSDLTTDISKITCGNCKIRAAAVPDKK